jgi:hypothetical protein
MDKVQRIDRRNTAPSSKTFRDENKALLAVVAMMFRSSEQAYECSMLTQSIMLGRQDGGKVSLG